MSRFEAFAPGGLKVACGLLVAGIAIGAALWEGHAMWRNRASAKYAPLAEPKAWPSTRIELLENAQFKLLTIWREGRLYYQFSVDRYPKAVAAARDGGQGTPVASPQFTILFLDRNRFRLFEHSIALTAMTKEVDLQGKVAGLSASGDTPIDPELYGQAALWDFTWNFATAAAEPPRPSSRAGSPVAAGKAPKPEWRDLSRWATLKRGMSRQEVRRILGEPTRIEEMTSITFWRYGDPKGGVVAFNSTGTVSLWLEP